MNRYILINGYILELPVLLAVLTLVSVSLVTLLAFFYGSRLKSSRAKKALFFGLGLVLLLPVFGVLFYSDVLDLDRSPQPLTGVVSDYGEASAIKQHHKYRYAISQDLNKLGLISTIYDDGSRTYFGLSSPNVPSVLVEGEGGDLIDQKDHVVVKTIPDHPFPMLIVSKLSMVWYLQFDNLISHVIQNPVFKPSYDSRTVAVYYSDTHFSNLELRKDRFVCNQGGSQSNGSSIPRSRHYYVFKTIRYYIDDCFVDYSPK